MEDHIYPSETALSAEGAAADAVMERSPGAGRRRCGRAPAAPGPVARVGTSAYPDLNEESGPLRLGRGGLQLLGARRGNSELIHLAGMEIAE